MWRRREVERRTVPAKAAVSGAGFSLLELIIVLTIVGLLVGIALPMYKDATLRAQEAVLKEDLVRMRGAIEEFYTDRSEYPAALEDLVTAGYLRAIPKDPITESAESWEAEYAPWEMLEEGQPAGIWNVRSGADGIGLDGSPYSEW